MKATNEEFIEKANKRYIDKTTKPVVKKYIPNSFPIHPFADEFPEMTNDEMEALKEDIKEHGIRTPVVLVARLIDRRAS
jgi:hypothetical protein